MATQTLHGNTQRKILALLQEYSVLAKNWSTLAVYVGGSFGAGSADEHSDLDVFVLCPEALHATIVDHFTQAGLIDKDESFFVELPIPPFAHFSIAAFESARRSVRDADCELMYGYSHSIILHDPEGLFAQIQKDSMRLPSDATKTMLKREYWRFVCETGMQNNALKRGEREVLCLCGWKGLEHALRICCLLDGKPYPLDKGIVHAGLSTTAGSSLTQLFRGFFDLLQTDVLRRSDTPLAEPAMPRHEGLQYSEYYALRRRLKQELKSRLREAGLEGRWLDEW